LTAVSKRKDTFFDDYVEFESASERVIARTENFVAFVPFAPRWPLEIVIMPRRAIGDFTDLTKEERDEIVDLLPRVLRTLNALHGSAVPYISAWYQAPVGLTGQEFRFHLRITSPKRSKDRLKILAGSETAMGAFILDVTPELQAGQLRELIIGT
jgi:UDPglucose--hexose-1-phosphate uridylyltransferase